MMAAMTSQTVTVHRPPLLVNLHYEFDEVKRPSAALRGNRGDNKDSDGGGGAVKEVAEKAGDGGDGDDDDQWARRRPF